MECVLRAGLAWRHVEDALASSQALLQTSQWLLDQPPPTPHDGDARTPDGEED
jgi:hypothetical protein